MMRTVKPGISVLFAASALVPATHAQIADTPPPGAPSAKCEVRPRSDPRLLRVLVGTTTLPYVFACAENRPAGKCVVGFITPGSRETPANTALAVDHEQDGWSCVSLDAVTGWVPSNRLAPLPSQPSVPESWWLGWWRMGPGQTGIQNDRLLITKSTVPGQLRVSGRAYWYGINNNVHLGQINAEAQPYGLYLHLTEGNDTYSCVLDLIANPDTHTISATDNSNCGGMNVRFSGTWNQFTPRSRKLTSKLLTNH
jgi:hypothetical protein